MDQLTDEQKKTLFGSTEAKVPKSCCKKQEKEEDITQCQKEPGNDKYETHMKGCFKKLKDSVKNHKSKILGVAIAILVVMVRFTQIASKKFILIQCINIFAPKKIILYAYYTF